MPQIFVYLLNEGTDCWRPVEATHLGRDHYVIAGVNADPEDEEWQFQTGDVVRCERRLLSGGECLVAVEVLAPSPMV